MLDYLFSEQAGWFAAPALLGTAVFALRVALMSLGAADVELGEVDLDSGGFEGDDVSGHDSDQAFSVLSVQSITAFLGGFGWVGLIAYRSLDMPTASAVALGAVGGVAFVWLLAWLFKIVWSLQSSGTMNIETALGSVGDVYTTVPRRGDGVGQVRVIIENRQRIYNAVSEGDALPTRERVRVVAVNDDNTLTVTAA